MWQATLNGVTVGDDTRYRWTDTPTLFGIDNLRVNTSDIAGGHGEVNSGPDLLPGADRTFVVLVDGGADPRYALTLFETLQEAWQPTDTDVELTLVTPDRTYGLIGRPRRAVPDLTLAPYGAVTVALQFRQSDPRFYEPNMLIVGNMGVSSGGLSFPFGFPFAFGTSTPGMFTLANHGNTGSWFSVIASAPVEAMIDPIFKLDDGRQVVFTGLTVPAGGFLLVNWQNRQAVMTTDLVNFIDVGHTIDRARSDWWTGDATLPPGDPVVSWVGEGSAIAFISWRPAWIL